MIEKDQQFLLSGGGCMKVSASMLSVCVLTGMGSWVRAQPEPPAPPPAWSGEGGLSYVRSTGNSENATLGAAIKVVREKNDWKATGLGSVIRATDREVKTAERLDAALRLERALSARFSAYGQSTYQR